MDLNPRMFSRPTKKAPLAADVDRLLASEARARAAEAKAAKAEARAKQAEAEARAAEAKAAEVLAEERLKVAEAKIAMARQAAFAAQRQASGATEEQGEQHDAEYLDYDLRAGVEDASYSDVLPSETSQQHALSATPSSASSRSPNSRGKHSHGATKLNSSMYVAEATLEKLLGTGRTKAY